MDLPVSYITIIIFIVSVIIIIIILASIYYNGNDEDVQKMSKSFREEPISVSIIKPEIEYNTYVFKTLEIDSNISYIVNGNFSRSSISLYLLDTNEREYTQIFDGDFSVIFTSNLSLSSPSFKLAEHKCLLIPLTMGKKYKICINKVNNLKVLAYKVNYRVSHSPFYLFDKDGTIGTGEYDIETYVRQSMPQIKSRVYPKIYNHPNKWIFREDGKYIILYINNLYNFNIEGNDNINVTARYTKKGNVTYEIIEVTNPSILITNLDYQEEVKNINTEYIDFITAPNYLMNRFLNGVQKKNINYSNLISDKILIYKTNQ